MIFAATTTTTTKFCSIYYIHSQTNNLTSTSCLIQIWPIDTALNLVRSLLIIKILKLMTARDSQSLTAYPPPRSQKIMDTATSDYLDCGIKYTEKHHYDPAWAWSTLWTNWRVKCLLLPKVNVGHFSFRTYLFHRENRSPSSGLESQIDSVHVAMETTGKWLASGL